jgi:hypothetical protein
MANRGPNVRFGSLADICSAKGHVRSSPNSDRESDFPQTVMSALLPKADICSALAHVCFGPIADIPANRSAALSSDDACNAGIDFATKRPEIDGLGEKRFGATLQRLALGLGIAISGDHNDRYIGPSGLGFRQEFKTNRDGSIVRRRLMTEI